MVTGKQIKDLLHAVPFRPFRIYLSDGTHHDITNHDMAWAMKNYVEIGLNVDPDGMAEYAVRCSILHITKLEDLPAQVGRRPLQSTFRLVRKSQIAIRINSPSPSDGLQIGRHRPSIRFG